MYKITSLVFVYPDFLIYESSLLAIEEEKINMQNIGRLLMGLLPILAECFSIEADLEIAF